MSSAHACSAVTAGAASRRASVGDARALGSTAGETVLSGYVVIAVDDFEGVVEVAKGCPGLSQGGGAEIGETVAGA